MNQIQKNKEELLDEIEKLGMRPMTPSVAEKLSEYIGAYYALCEIEEDEGQRSRPMQIGYDTGSRTDARGRYTGRDMPRNRYEPYDRYDDGRRGVRNIYELNERNGTMDYDDREDERRPFARALDTSVNDAQLTKDVAEQWLTKLKNVDGTKGAHWTMQQTDQVLTKYGMNYDPVEFWVVMNLIYSDEVAVAKRYNVNTIEYYKDRAKAWLDDPDAKPNKTARYLMSVVQN